MIGKNQMKKWETLLAKYDKNLDDVNKALDDTIIKLKEKRV